MRRQVHFERPLRMPQVQLQRQRRDEQEGQRGEQRQPVGRLDRLHVEHALERRQDERARHQPGDERIEHDQDAPLELHLVRIHESLHARHSAFISHRSVEPVVEDLRAGRHLRLQHLDGVRAQELVNRIARVLQIRELARAGRTGLAARRLQPLRDAVVAERALVRRVGPRIDVAAAVGTGLHAVAAPEAVVLVDQHDAVVGLEGGADRADLRARRVDAVIAHLRHEERLALAVRVGLGKPVDAAVGRIDDRVIHVERIHVIALDPGPEEVGLVDDVVLELAGADAVAAADALLDVDEHRPPVIGGLVGVRLFGRAGQHVLERRRGDARHHEHLAAEDEEVATRAVHDRLGPSENSRVVRFVAGQAALATRVVLDDDGRIAFGLARVRGVTVDAERRGVGQRRLRLDRPGRVACRADRGTTRRQSPLCRAFARRSTMSVWHSAQAACPACTSGLARTSSIAWAR